ncbi:MAG TPA: hypothetical protein VLX92_30675 [Kofleriaceae bacterium]|nr:hypothetical protein [Kofleriaceae bacterium]
MRVPVWLTLGVAAVVIAFGGFRIYLATRKRAANEADAKRGGAMGGGFYKMSPRTHLLVGVVYLLLGGALIATSLGWNPLGGAFGPSTQTPPKSEAPTKGGIPIDQIQTPNKK